MKLEVQQKDIADAVSLVEKMSGKNLSLPVLNTVLFIAEKGKCILRATNLDIGVEYTIPASVEEEGVVAVSGSTLLGNLQTMRSSTVAFKTVNDNLEVVGGKGNSLLKTQPSEDFPTLPKAEGEEVVVKAADFMHGLKSVWYSASLSSIKPELSSVFVNFEGGKMIFVATDSFRLAEKIIPTSSTASYGPILIPYRNVGEIIRTLSTLSGDITLVVNQNQLSFSTDSLYLTSRLVEGSFPDYKQIIPKQFLTEVTLLREDMIQTLKKTAIFSDKFNQLQVAVSIKKKSCAFSSENPDVGKTEEVLKGEVAGEDIVINFNQKYLADVFQSLTADSVILSLGGVGKPMVIGGSGDSSFLYLVMPMNR